MLYSYVRQNIENYKNLIKKTLLLIAIICGYISHGQDNSFNNLKIELDLPLFKTDSISMMEYNNDDLRSIKLYLSPVLKDKSFAELNGLTKVQMRYSNTITHLCDLLKNCDNTTYAKNKALNVLENYPAYSEKIDYRVEIYSDKNVILKDVEYLSSILLKMPNVKKLYFALAEKETNQELTFYHFNPKKGFFIISNSNEKFKDWVQSDFKINFGETIEIPED